MTPASAAERRFRSLCGQMVCSLAMRTLTCFVAALGLACAHHDTAPVEPHGCAAVGDHFVELAEARKDPEAVSLLPLLDKLRGQLVGECTKKDWSLEARQCFIDARTPAEAEACAPLSLDLAEGMSLADLKPHDATAATAGRARGSAAAGDAAKGADSDPNAAAEPVTPPGLVQRDTCSTPDGQLLRCVHRFIVGHRPKSLAFRPHASELWVSLHYDRPAVEIYSTETWEQVGSVDMGRYGAVELTFSPDGMRAYVSQLETASVYQILADERAVERVLETKGKGSKVVALAPDAQTLYVANWYSKDISVFDVRTGEQMARFPVSGIPRGLYPSRDGTALWISGFSPGYIYRADLTANNEVKSIRRPGNVMRHVVGDEDRGALYFSDMKLGKVWRLDLATEEITELAATDSHPNTIDLSPDGRVIFVSNRGENNPDTFLKAGPQWGSIVVIDAYTGAHLDGVITGNQATGLDVSPDGRMLAVTDFLDNAVNIYEIPETADLLAGNGGRYQAHKGELDKQNWKGADDEARHNLQLIPKKYRDRILEKQRRQRKRAQQ